jgi:hypothetical protein
MGMRAAYTSQFIINFSFTTLLIAVQNKEKGKRILALH